jgi:chorismate mutase
MSINLQSLGLQLQEIDRQLITLVAKRMEVAKQVGFTKYLDGQEISRPSIEDKRIEDIKRWSMSVGVNPNLAASLLYSLMDEACKVQMAQLQAGSLLFDNFTWLPSFGRENTVTHMGRDFSFIDLNPKHLSQKDRNLVFHMIYPVALSAFGQRHTEAFANDVRSHVLDHDKILMVRRNGEVVAFCAWDVIAETFIYLAGICVSKDSQAGGLGRLMIEKIIHLTGLTYPSWAYFALRTQNWSMRNALHEVSQQYTSLHSFGDEDIPTDVRSAADFVARHILDPYLQSDRLVSRRIYGSSLYGEADSVQAGFKGLSIEQGDAAYCVMKR